MTAKWILVAGATASGKSSLAIRLARALDGEIVNIDSVQLYRGLTIGSGKVGAAERAEVAHHMLDLIDAHERMDAAEFAARAWQAIESIEKRGKQVILVVGTTLYLKSLLYGLADAPKADPKLRARFEEKSAEELYSWLQEIDRQRAAELNPNDRLRISRALEIALLSQRSNSEIYKGHEKSPKRSCLCILISLGRAQLHQRIQERVHRMLEEGLVEETRSTLASCRGANPQWGSSLGYHECIQFLNGEFSYAELEERISTKTRQFAKRQLTFWRNEPRKLGWMIRPQSGEGILVGNGRSKLGGKAPSEERAYSYAWEELIGRMQRWIGDENGAPELWRVDGAALC